ncbi:MAG: c-type cytochrome [Proteobacteria bacterium]|nr:c-type cytochrome [Pseudomonadota bacterium]
MIRMSLPLLMAMLALGTGTSTASEESVDRATKSALALDAHPKAGALLYARNCQSCHGEKAGGDPARNIPTLAGQRFTYLVRQMADFAGRERDSREMHRALSGAELKIPQAWVDIAAWLSALPMTPVVQNGDGKHLGLGEGIFREQCASCHREDARGDDDGYVPSLRGQHQGYLATQIHGLANGRRHNLDENLMRFFNSFEDPDIAAVADYLSRLKGAGQSRQKMRDDGTVVD